MKRINQVVADAAIRRHVRRMMNKNVPLAMRQATIYGKPLAA